MDIPCECMADEDEFGQMVCRRCRGDWYGCECPHTHTRKCQNDHSRDWTPEEIRDVMDDHVIMGPVRKLYENGFRVTKAY